MSVTGSDKEELSNLSLQSQFLGSLVTTFEGGGEEKKKEKGNKPCSQICN
jgi:hypothetical protein